MIKPAEIQKKARAAGVRDQQIEKDYMLSWVLYGIAQHKTLSKQLVFKGGTALKKAYFKEYRFSEDLDFTLLDIYATNDLIITGFREAFDFVADEANIPLEIIENNHQNDSGLGFFISYVGPLGGLGFNKKIKVDISRHEIIIFSPVVMPAKLSYSDLDHHQLLCYSLEEILVEKLRSVMQRMQARDFYDLWYLVTQRDMDISFVVGEFKEKCMYKNLNPADFQGKLSNRLPQYKGRWKHSLKEQIKDLPDYEKVERELIRHLKKTIV